MSVTNTQTVRIPYLDDAGDLIIPFDSAEKYQHWKGGQSVFITLAEMNAPAQAFKQRGYRVDADGDECKCGKAAGRVEEIYYCAACLLWWEIPARLE